MIWRLTPHRAASAVADIGRSEAASNSVIFVRRSAAFMVSHHPCLSMIANLRRCCKRKSGQTKRDRVFRGLSLSIKSIFTPEQQPRGSAHEKAFAAQTHQNRGRVPRFGYFKREKVSVWELSDVRVLRSSKHRLSEKRSFSTVSDRVFRGLFDFSLSREGIRLRTGRPALRHARAWIRRCRSCCS